MEPAVAAKNRHIPRKHAGRPSKEIHMRIAQVAFTGVFALAVLTGPTLAKNATTQKADEPAASPTCSAYQQAPDGSWAQLPCKEHGDRDQAAPQRNSTAPSKTRTR
jgi:hypothetical protein